MPTLFEQWLKDTQFHMPQAAQPQDTSVTDWAYKPTPAAVPAKADEPGVGIFGRAMALLQIPQQVVTGAIKGSEDFYQEAKTGHLDPLDFLRPAGDAISGAAKATDIVARGKRHELVDPEQLYLHYSAMKDRPETQNMTAAQLDDYVKNVRSPEYQAQKEHMSGWQKAIRSAGNLAASFGTDPMTYVGGEAIGAVKNAARNALGPGKLLDDAIAATTKGANVPEGLSPGQAAAAVSPSSIKVGGTTVPIDTVGASQINRFSPTKTESIPVGATVADRGVPEVSPASATVEAAPKATPAPLMEPAETAPGFNTDMAEVAPGAPLEELATKVEANPNLPMGAAAVADKAAADVPTPMPTNKAELFNWMNDPANRARSTDVAKYDATVAKMTNEENLLNHQDAMYKAESAAKAGIQEQAMAEWTGKPQNALHQYSEGLQDELHSRIEDGMDPRQAMKELEPSFAAEDYAVNHPDEINAAITAARKSVPYPTEVLPEHIKARFEEAPPTAPIEAKAAAKTVQKKAAAEAIPKADSIEEAKAEVGDDPASVYQALQAGAAANIPKELKGVVRAIEKTVTGDKLDVPGEVGAIVHGPSDQTVIGNMVLDKLGIKPPKKGADPFALSAAKFKIGGKTHVLDLEVMVREYLSGGRYGDWLKARTKAFSKARTDWLVKHGHLSIMDVPKHSAEVDTAVLFKDPEFTEAMKSDTGVIDTVQRQYHAEGMKINPNGVGMRLHQEIEKIQDRAANLMSEIEAKSEQAYDQAAFDKQSYLDILEDISAHEHEVEKLEAQIAVARKARKAVKPLQAELDALKKDFAEHNGDLTRETAAASYKTASDEVTAIEDEIAGLTQELRDLKPKLKDLKTRRKSAIDTELRKRSEAKAIEATGAAYRINEVADDTVLTIGTSDREITWGGIKDAIDEAAAEYQSVVNLTRKSDRAPSRVPGVRPPKPDNVTPEIPDGTLPKTQLIPAENPKAPAVQAANNSVLRELTPADVPTHPQVIRPNAAVQLDTKMREVIHLTDKDIETPYMRWGNDERYMPLNEKTLILADKAHKKPLGFFQKLYDEGGVAALHANGLEDVVAGAFPLEKQVAMASRLKGIFHFGGRGTRNDVNAVFNKPTARKLGEKQEMTKEGVEAASLAAWDTLLATEASYGERGANFITNYFPKDPQRLSDVIAVAARDATEALGQDVHPSLFMTLKGAHTAKALDNPQLVAYINDFWESIPFISRNFDGARDAAKAAQWVRLSDKFPSIARAQRFAADEYGVPTRAHGLNAKVQDWHIQAEPGASIGIQKEMSRTNPDKILAAKNEGEVLSKAQEPVKEQHAALDEAYGESDPTVDDGGTLKPAPGHGPNPGHGYVSSRSQAWNAIKQFFRREYGHNDQYNLVADNNSLAKNLDTQSRNVLEHLFGEERNGWTNEQVSKAIFNYRFAAPGKVIADPVEQQIVDNFNVWVQHTLVGPESTLTRSGMPEEYLMEFLVGNKGGKEEVQNMLHPEHVSPKVKPGADGKLTIPLFDDAYGVLNNINNGVVRALARWHWENEVIAKWTSPVSTGERTAEVEILGKKYFMTPQYAQDFKSSHKIFTDLLTYTPGGPGWVKEIDAIQGMWKTGETILRPGHHVRNGLGNSVILASGLTRTGHAAEYVGDAIDIMRDFSDFSPIMKPKTHIPNMKEINDLMSTGKVADPTLMRGATEKVVFKPKGQPPVTNKMIAGELKRKGMWQSAEVAEDTLRGVGGNQTRFGTMNEKMSRLPGVRDMRRLSAVQEHTFRTAMYRGELEANMNKGMTFEKASDKAANKARRYFPDGLMLSKFEKNWMRRIVPFYTYTRTIMGPLTEIAITKPHVAAAPLKAQMAVGQVWGGDDNGAYPDWMSKAYPMGPTYSIGSAQIAMDVGSQHLDTFKMLQDFPHSIPTQMSPLFTVPYSWATGADVNSTPLRSTGEKVNMALNDTVPLLNSLFPAVTGHRLGGEQDGDYTRQLAWINYLTGLKNKQLNTPKTKKNWELEQRAKARNG